ncbi:MAG: PUA domain-containing protein [Promethearchaeota archaeon]
MKNFRKINNLEKKIILDSIFKISSKILALFKKIESELFISLNGSDPKKNYPSVFLIQENLVQIIQNFTPQINLCSAGLYFGFIKKNQFYLSLEGTEFLDDLGIFSEKYKILVNDRGEKSLFYGNQVLKKFIFKIPKNLKKNDFLLIKNKENELIALGRAQLDYQSIKYLNSKEVVALNLIDKGTYLRTSQ